jgi:hypothetical protein
MLIKKANSPITGLINALILAVPAWAMIALVYFIVTRF